MTDTMTPSQIAEAISAEIRRHGWCQGQFESPSGQVCLTEAVGRAASRIDALRGVVSDMHWTDTTRTLRHDSHSAFLRPEWVEFWRELSGRCTTEVKQHDGHVSPPSLLNSPWIRHNPWTWNDLASTTEEDVHLMLKRTAEALEERSQDGSS